MDSIKKSFVYPEECINKAIQGKVEIRLLIDKNGKPLKHIVKKSPGRCLTLEVESKLYSLRFSPAINKEGKITKCWLNVPFSFVLEGVKPKKSKKQKN